MRQRIVTLSRTYRFSAAHYYHDPGLDDAANARLFGKCANQHGHGHNYRCEVRLRGVPAVETGMLFDLRTLDRIVHETVLERLDHRNLNAEVEAFATQQPTCENLAGFVWETLAPQLPPGLLDAVRLYETDDLWAEYRG